jgi:hypothetical protein
MKKTICDRCGKEIKDTFVFDPESIYAHYDIRAIVYTRVRHPGSINEQWTIDLCPSCEKELSYWLHNKEAK